MFEKETIAAIATGMTDSGIGIIRISGDNAVEIGDSLFVSPSGKHILKLVQSHVLYYGYIIENKNSENFQSDIIDEVMTVVMKAPRSYTGEDTVEIQCHGGILVMQKILKACLQAGARMALPGEFSKRAFLNGRIDLTRAEAVMDLIHSQNEYAYQSSVNQLQGSLCVKIKELRAKIIHEIAFIESALDDPEHFDMEGYPEKIKNITQNLIEEIGKLISTAENGKLIKEGIRTVIVGKPNAGKSSFMNLLIGEDRAIVTDIAGTTRDVLKEYVKMGDISLQIVDTAGIRSTEDVVEKIGVEKAIQYAQDADFVLFVVDSSTPIDKNDIDIISYIKDKKILVLLNKSDLETVVKEEDIEALFKDKNIKNDNYVIIKTSAKTNLGLEAMEAAIKDMFFHGDLKMNHEIVITNLRHKEALEEALESLKLVSKSIEDEMPEDFLSIDLMNAYAYLGRIIGEEVDDDLIDEIFQKFCLGK